MDLLEAQESIAMAQSQADRNLLLGLVALRNDLVDRETLLTALSVCVADGSRPLSQILRERGNLDTEKCKLLETLVDAQLAASGQLAPEGQGVESLKFLSTAWDEPSPATEAGTNPAVVVANPADGTIGGALDGNDPFLTRSEGCSDQPTSRGDDGGYGRFHILRPHAKGGLGQVSVALDRELDRSVAVKEIQDRYADHPISRARFIEEAEITGKLEHPGVIPVYSLGRHADGRPYYAMRFVKGDSLKTAIQRFHEDEALRHNPAERSLRLRELLRRFLDACNAIAYAHSRGILHRDLKPDNIMLGPYGETLVVDWGLAKSLENDPETTDKPSVDLDLVDGPIRLSSQSGSRADTLAGSAMGTPAYASPEQVTGRVDVMGQTTDVYGLGATLYHLLTGKPPVSGSSLREILEQVRDGTIPPPRSIDPTIPAGLDAICHKAMATRQLERYRTVQEMAEDINRWLADETVTAHRETASQRLRRWLRKHPTATAVTGVLFLSGLIAAGIIIGVVTRKNVQIARMADDAERSLEVACLGTDALLTEVADVELADIPQMEPVRRRLLEKAEAGFQKFLDRNENTPVLSWVSGRARGRMGEILELTGHYKESEQSYRLAAKILGPLVTQDPDEPSYRGDLVRSRLGLGILYKKSNRFQEAESELRRAADECKPFAATAPEPYRRLQGDIDYQLGALWAKSAGNAVGSKRIDPDPDREGEEAYRRAVQVQQDLVQESREHPDQRARLGRSLNNLAKLLAATGRADEAERLLRDAIALVRDAQALPGPRWQYARASHNLGVLLLRSGGSIDAKLAQPARTDEGLELLKTAKGLLENLKEEFPKVPQYRQELATISLNLGRIKRMRKLNAEAQAELDQAIDLAKLLANEFPEIPDYRLELARAILERADTPAPGLASSIAEEALALEAIKELESLAAEYQTVGDYRNELGRGYFHLAKLHLAANRLAEARSAVESAIRCQNEAVKSNPRNHEYLSALRDDFFLNSIVLRELGEMAKAADAAEELPRLAPDDLFAYYRAATLLTECAVSSKPNGEDYARRAVEVLKKAVQRHLIQIPDQLELKEFRNLKEREDFLKLFDSLGPPKAG